MPELEVLKKSKSHHWLLFVLRGLIAILLGIIMLASPAAGLAFLVAVFGVFAIVDGIFAIALGTPFRRFGFVAIGILSILAGIAAFVRPLMTATTLIYLIAAWAIVIGLIHLYDSVFGRKGEGVDWLVALSGIAGVVLGGLILMNPMWGLLAVVMAAGVYAIVAGICFLALGFRLRGFQKHLGERGRLAPA
jgi:uncharacterized membrane protein HdeD (DUF308 family)